MSESSLFCPALKGNRSCKTYNVRTKTYNFRTKVSNVQTVSSTIYRLLTLQQLDIYHIYNHSTSMNPLLIITNPSASLYVQLCLSPGSEKDPIKFDIVHIIWTVNHKRNDVCCELFDFRIIWNNWSWADLTNWTFIALK